MKRLVSALLFVLVAIDAVLFLLPITLVYIIGAAVSIIFFFEALIFTMRAMPHVLGLNVFILLSGYALYSLWWLLIRHRKIKIDEISKFIWGGLVVGGLITVFIIFEGVWSRTGSLTSQKDMAYLIFAGGPLMLTLTLLAIMLPRKRL